jgi:hypothetical protein
MWAGRQSRGKRWSLRRRLIKIGQAHNTRYRVSHFSFWAIGKYKRYKGVIWAMPRAMARVALGPSPPLFPAGRAAMPCRSRSREKLGFCTGGTEREKKTGSSKRRSIRVGSWLHYRNRARARQRDENARHRLCRAPFPKAHGKGRPTHFYPVKIFVVRFGKRQRTAQLVALRNRRRTAKKRC